MRPAKSPRQKNLRDTSSEFFISTCKDLFLRNKDRQIIGFSFDGSFCRRLLIMMNSATIALLWGPSKEMRLLKLKTTKLQTIAPNLFLKYLMGPN